MLRLLNIFLGLTKANKSIAQGDSVEQIATIQLAGWDFGSATIAPNEYVNGSFSICKISASLSEAHRDLIINCAGYGALPPAGCTEYIPSNGCDDDFSKAQELIYNQLLPTLYQRMNQAEHLLSFSRSTTAVICVAHELIEH